MSHTWSTYRSIPAADQKDRSSGNENAESPNRVRMRASCRAFARFAWRRLAKILCCQLCCCPLVFWRTAVYFRFNIYIWKLNMIQSCLMYRSNRSFNMPPPRAYPGHSTPLPSRGGGNLIIRVFQGVGNLIPMLKGWGIWTAPSISCKIFGVASYHWGRDVRGFSWKRLCLWGQLVARKGLKQACAVFKVFLF